MQGLTLQEGGRNGANSTFADTSKNNSTKTTALGCRLRPGLIAVLSALGEFPRGHLLWKKIQHGPFSRRWAREMCSRVSAQLQAPAIPRSSSLLPTLCLSLPPRKPGKMSPERQQRPSAGCRGLTRARGEKVSMLTARGRMSSRTALAP